MMSISTPESNKTIRNSVHTNGGISKSLLTPCRRIGLSKNRKKQNNCFIPAGSRKDIASPVDSEIKFDNVTRTICDISNIANTTKMDSATVNIQTESKTTKTQKNYDSKNCKRDLILKEVKINECESEIFKKKYCGLKSNVKPKSINISNLENDNAITCSNNDAEIQSTQSADDSMDVNMQKALCQTRKTHSKLFPETNIDNDTNIPNDTENYIINSITNKFNSNKNIECEYVNQVNDVKQEKQIEKKLSDNRHDTKPKNYINAKKTRTVDQQRTTTKTIKRKLSMKKTISCSNFIESDEEVFTNLSTKINEPIEKENYELIDEIIQLEKVIQNKETDFQKLQQVQIYQSLHKLEDINLETNNWKLSCQEALKDLLKNLKEHAAIDMNTLLQNLKVPLHLFKYDVENDCFL